VETESAAPLPSPGASRFLRSSRSNRVPWTIARSEMLPPFAVQRPVAMSWVERTVGTAASSDLTRYLLLLDLVW